MEFKVKITVKIATGDGATTIIDGTMTIAIVAGTMTGCGEFRGLTEQRNLEKARQRSLENCQLAFLRPRLAFFFLAPAINTHTAEFCFVYELFEVK